MAARKRRSAPPILLIVGQPPWRKKMFELYVSHPIRTKTMREEYTKGAYANRWRHVQIVTITPEYVDD